MSADYGPEWSASLRRGTDAELRGWVETALGWCDHTDAIAMQYFRASPHTVQKPDGSFVTAADTAIEDFVTDRLVEVFPTHGAIGEELGDRPSDASSVVWFIDPIDGTHNFLRGVPIFATLLGIARDGELQASVISAPALRTRWYAWRGGGAWEADAGSPPKRIRVSAIAELSNASVSYSSAGELEASGLAPGFHEVLASVWRDRGYGDFWSYTLVAGGALDAMFEHDLSIWDAAAPAVLVEEAGGRVTDFEGGRVFDGGTLLATNGLLHETVRSMLVHVSEGGEPR